MNPRWVRAQIVNGRNLEMEKFTCSICFLPCEEWPNNADPVNDGKCCKKCDDTVVIRARINQMRHRDAMAVIQEKTR